MESVVYAKCGLHESNGKRLQQLQFMEEES